MSSPKNEAIGHFNDGNKLYKVQLYDEALLQYEKAISIAPTLHDAHFCVAKTRLRIKKFKSGIAHFNKYIHLIPFEKQDAYIIALANILLEEKKPMEALNLMNNLDKPETEEETFNYVPFLIANNRTTEAIHKILNLNDKDKISTGYKNLIENKKLSEENRNKLKNENIIPHYFNSLKTSILLKSSGILHKEFAPSIEELQSQLEKIKSNEKSNYTLELQKVDEIIEKVQTSIASYVETVLKSNNFLLAKKQINILEQTKYNTELTASFRQKLRKLEKTRNDKSLKKIAVLVISFIIVFTIGFFGYQAYEKSEARAYTVASNSVSAYTSYLNTYGHDAEINKFRETKLYKTAIKSNTTLDFNNLISLYPSSEYLKSISINILGSKSHSLKYYGLGNKSHDKRINNNTKNQFEVPEGAKVGYIINAAGMIPIERTFIVGGDLQIEESLTPAKELILNEEFNSNTNGWSTFSSSKVVYGIPRYKNAAVVNGELRLINELNDKQFSISLMNFTKLTEKQNFEIEASITMNKINSGIFLLFGATTGAFNYVGFNGNRRYLYGYNDWSNKNTNWIKLSNGWITNRNINRGNYTTNIIKIVKENDKVSMSINNSFLGSMPNRAWYGKKIGFGINDKTSGKINYLKIYKKKNRVPVSFKEGNTYFSCVSLLNVRSEPILNSEIITTIKLAEPVKLLKEESGRVFNATFNGIPSPEKYYRVELLDGTVGWVHGGALKDVPSKKAINFSTYKKYNNDF
jgi:tetratricopeptide (TPR) repeat protein